MVGVLLAAGSGKLNQRDIYEMLTIPSKKSWNFRVPSAPSAGLYLTDVEYPPGVVEKHTRTFEQINGEDEIVETAENEDSDDYFDEIDDSYLRK